MGVQSVFYLKPGNSEHKTKQERRMEDADLY